MKMRILSQLSSYELEDFKDPVNNNYEQNNYKTEMGANVHQSADLIACTTMELHTHTQCAENFYC